MKAINLSLVAIPIFVFIGLILFTRPANALQGGERNQAPSKLSEKLEKEKREIFVIKKGATLSFIDLVDPIKAIQRGTISR